MSATKTSDPSPTLLSTVVGDVGITREGDSDKMPILCVHGIPGSHRDFRYLAPLLTDAFQVIRLDMPGFGASPLGTISSVAGWAETVAAVADRLSLDAHLVLGHSFGGGAVLHTAVRFPDRVAGAVLLASPGPRQHRGYGGFPPRFYQHLAKAAATPVVRSLVLRFSRHRFAAMGLRAPDDWRILHRQLTIIGSLDFPQLGRMARQISCPAVLAHSADDPLVEIAIARELAALLPAAESLFFPEGGHHLQKHRAPEISRRIREVFA